MPQPRKQWVYAPEKPAPPKAPDALKREVETKSNALVESVLKPLHVQPAPEDPQFNYIEDIATKWVRSYFYFCAALSLGRALRAGWAVRGQVRPPDIPRRRSLQPGRSAPHRGVDADLPRSDAG